MLSVEASRLSPDSTSPRASSWSGSSYLEIMMPGSGDMWTSEQVNELLTSIDGSGPASPHDSNYTYASTQTSGAPQVVLSPSWSLPRRQGGVEQNTLASLQQYQQNNPLPDMSTLNMVSSAGMTGLSMLSSADLSSMLSAQSPPDMATFGTPFSASAHSHHAMPFSAPADSFEFDNHIDYFPQEQADFLQPGQSQRQSSWPLSPPPLPTPSPLPEHQMRAGTLPPEVPSAPPQMFGRRRSISMSGIDLQAAATAAVSASHASRSGPVRPRPNRNRSASNLSHHRVSSQSQRSQNAPDSLYSVPRSPSAKERRAVASKRRATLQSVIADAKLPSASSTSAPQPILQQPQSVSIASATLQPPAPVSSSSGSSSVNLTQALNALAQAQSYIEDTLGPSGDGDSGFVTASHLHLLRDLRARLKTRSEMGA